MLQREAVIKSTHGLHARPSCAISTFAQTLKNTKVTITTVDTKDSADARSILSMLALGLPTKTRIMVSAEGEEEQRALDEVCRIITEYDVDD